MQPDSEQKPERNPRRLLYEIIFESDTPSGKLFDVLLLVAIVLSVIAVSMESVPEIRSEHRKLLYIVEWIFTLLFSVEYIFRLISVRRPLAYALSFFGIVDLLAILPTFLSLLISGAQSLLVIRVFRLLRIFRIFKLTRYMNAAGILMVAMKASRLKITVFLGAVLAIVVSMGSLMYLIEGPENGFASIPAGIYWAIVTLTTVGYGDIAPQTVLGRAIASFVMILGYGIIAVPTGIVTVEMAEASKQSVMKRNCTQCHARGHQEDARYCRICGTKLEDEKEKRTT